MKWKESIVNADCKLTCCLHFNSICNQLKLNPPELKRFLGFLYVYYKNINVKGSILRSQDVSAIICRNQSTITEVTYYDNVFGIYCNGYKDKALYIGINKL